MSSWNATSLADLLEELRAFRGDTTSVEVKRAAGGLPDDLATTICAFANMPEGGTIILGVDESTGFDVVGVVNPAKTIAALVNKARDAVKPAPEIDAYPIQIGSTQVVVAEVASLPLFDRPARTGGQAYLRQADGDYVMHEHELRMLEVEKHFAERPVSWDFEPVAGAGISELDSSLVSKYIADVRATDRRLAERSDDEILRRTGVIGANGQVSLAALYSMGDYPQGFYPSLTVTAAVQLPRETGSRVKSLQDFTGPLPVLLDDILEWCEENVPRIRRYRDDGRMEDIPEFPIAAIRELVANALVHRDLSPQTLGIGKSIQIRLTPTNLMVLSPGGLRGISRDQLLSQDHAQAAVNQHLYRMAKRLTTADGLPIIEGEGGGIAEVLHATRDYGLPRPTFVNTGVQFKVLMWGMNSTKPAVVREARTATTHVISAPPTLTNLTAPVTKNEPVIVSALSSNDGASISELQQATSLSKNQLRYALALMVEHGRVEMRGEQGSQATQYFLANGS